MVFGSEMVPGPEVLAKYRQMEDRSPHDPVTGHSAGSEHFPSMERRGIDAEVSEGGVRSAVVAGGSERDRHGNGGHAGPRPGPRVSAVFRGPVGAQTMFRILREHQWTIHRSGIDRTVRLTDVRLPSSSHRTRERTAT